MLKRASLILLLTLAACSRVGPVAPPTTTFPVAPVEVGGEPTPAFGTTAVSTAPASATGSSIFVPVLPGDAPPAATASPTPEPTEEPAEAPADPPPVTMPVATPYISNIPDYTPRPELGPSKMGIHVARPNSEAIMAFVRAARPGHHAGHLLVG
jgi:hypothetical protein